MIEYYRDERQDLGHPPQRPLRRVIFLTHHLPWPPISGGRLREHELLRRLAARYDILVVAVSKTFVEDARHAVRLREYGLNVRVFQAERGCTDPEASRLVRRHWSSTAVEHLQRLLASPVELLHVQGHYLLGLVPHSWRHRALLVEHNVESDLVAQRLELSDGDADRRRLSAELRRTVTCEQAAWRQAGLLGAVTFEDRQRIQALSGREVRLVPNGADHVNLRVPGISGPTEVKSVLFFANFDYEPNLDAARILLTDIAPRLVARLPDVCIRLAGARMPAVLERSIASTSNVTAMGPVDCIEPYLDEATVVLCPLRVGGGVKVKILEALRRSKAIVTTPIGAQGLGAWPGALVVRDSPESLAIATLELLRDSQLRRRQELLAYDAAQRLPDWDWAADQLAHCWEFIAATAVTGA